MDSLNVVLISGSLRRGAVHTAALRAAAEAAPPGVQTQFYDAYDRLPHFNPDLDIDPLPPTVVEMRALLARADAALFSVPEYAGSLPGAFKNLLDWTVGGASLYERPVGWINAAAEGSAKDAHNDLARVLARAGAHVIEAASADVPVARADVDAQGRIGDAALRARLGGALGALVAEAHRRRREASSA
jgi:NAD(P)H-dependent FMN reductase